MSQMRKLLWSKLKSICKGSGSGRSGKKLGGSLRSKLSVNEEYVQAFRTKSYMEMWGKVQSQIRKTSIDGIDRLSTSSSSSHPFYQHLSEYLLEPGQETLKQMIENSKFHHLLIDYFEASLEACNVCELILRSIHQARTNHRRIKKVMKLCKKAQCTQTDSSSQVFSQVVTGSIFRELTAFALLKNPLSYISPLQFRNFHDSNLQLLRRLTLKEKKMRRRVKLNRICKKIGGGLIMFAHSALMIALIVISLHSIIGIFAAPGLMACSLASLKSSKNKVVSKRIKTSLLEAFTAQLDMAAKGIFILINDFDTMSRLARSLHDEIEHCRDVADMCVKNRKAEILKEVVREVQIHQSCFLKQSQELEDNVYLCLNTINRSRRLVIQEIMVAQQEESLLYLVLVSLEE